MKELFEYLIKHGVTEKLLEERQRVLDAIPECPVHGKCVPHALEWIEKAKASLSAPQDEGWVKKEKVINLLNDYADTHWKLTEPSLMVEDLIKQL